MKKWTSLKKGDLYKIMSPYGPYNVVVSEVLSDGINVHHPGKSKDTWFIGDFMVLSKCEGRPDYSIDTN